MKSLGFAHRNYFVEDDEPVLNAEVYRAIRFARQFTRLCPNLRNMNWDNINVWLDDIYLLLGPQIRRLQLAFNPIDFAAQSLIRSIPIICPHLTWFTVFVHGVHDDHEIRETIWEVFSCCQLTVVRCNLSISQRALQHLASMAALQEISLDLSGINNIASLSLTQCAFPALRSLELTGKMATALLDALSSCKLESIKIQFARTVNDAPLMTRFFQVLHARCSHRSLTAFDVAFDRSPVARHLDINVDMLRPLLSFVNLRKMVIRSCHRFKLDNDFVGAMAKAWPHLRILQLGSYGSWGGQSNVTLAGLVPLVQHCPDLSRLGLVIDATVVDHSLDIPVSNTKLKALREGKSPDKHAATDAGSSIKESPKLNSISGWSLTIHWFSMEDRVKYRGRWDEVVRLTKIFADVRQMERQKKDGCSDQSEQSHIDIQALTRS